MDLYILKVFWVFKIGLWEPNLEIFMWILGQILVKFLIFNVFWTLDFLSN